jgi:hypothetical protein
MEVIQYCLLFLQLVVEAAGKVERGQKVVKTVVLVAVQDEMVQLEQAFLDKEITVVLEIAQMLEMVEEEALVRLVQILVLDLVVLVE